jgi:hypothetical protein
VGKNVVPSVDIMRDAEMVYEALIRRQLVQVSHQRVRTDIQIAKIRSPE